MYAIFLGILICLLSLSQACFAQNEVQDSSFQYQVEVKDKETDEAISKAQITIEVLNRTPLHARTDSNGFARVFVDESYAGEPGRLRVKAKGYEIYEIEIDLFPDHLPQEVYLIKKYFNRLGLAMGYTHFKNIDGMTYTLAGAAYTHRIISYDFFDLTCYGYLDLTIMTSLNSEKIYESGISGIETTFGRAVSYSISYVQSFQLDNNFSLSIGAGFQRLVVDLNIDDGWDKLTKDSMLLGGGFEYNYRSFFVQTNLSAVIGEDKNLSAIIGEDKDHGHDIIATIKIGINFCSSFVNA